MTTMDQQDELGKTLISELVGAGLREFATDIHFEPVREELLVRFRYPDGLREVGRHSAEVGEVVRKQLKTMCQADVKVEDRPQDGRLLFETDSGERVFARVSTFPTVYGERMVVRLQSRLPHSWSGDGLEELELAEEQKQALLSLAASPSGLVLLTSSLGSSELLYPWLSTLTRRCEGRLNICSLESPVVSFLPGVAQTEIAPRSDMMNYAYSLRAISRQDPDVVACAAVPDAESARQLLRLALSGALVVAQVRSKDVAEALSLWTSFGFDSAELSQLSSVLRGVVAERTVRRTCLHCHGAACSRCHQTGFMGRVSVLQVEPWSEGDELQPFTSAADFRSRLTADWTVSARQAAEAGLTTAEESQRATA